MRLIGVLQGHTAVHIGYHRKFFSGDVIDESHYMLQETKLPEGSKGTSITNLDLRLKQYVNYLIYLHNVFNADGDRTQYLSIHML